MSIVLAQLYLENGVKKPYRVWFGEEFWNVVAFHVGKKSSEALMHWWKGIASLLQGSLSSGLPPAEITQPRYFKSHTSLANKFAKKVGKPDRQVLEGSCPDSIIWILSLSLFINLCNFDYLKFLRKQKFCSSVFSASEIHSLFLFFMLTITQ